MLPLLSLMAMRDWQGVSVLYVCPLRALLNNLQPRLHQYSQWLGRSTAVWHGDVGQPARQAILRDRPDVLLTTPESLEAMLVSTKVDPRVLFSGLRAVVIDEVHAFAGDDRGWHLLAVLERLSRLAGRDLQRIGLSATVGNPDELIAWLQGSFVRRRRSVVAPELPKPASSPDVTVDFVGSLGNAAKVIAALHAGEKRLVFVDSRRRAEEARSRITRAGCGDVRLTLVPVSVRAATLRGGIRGVARHRHRRHVHAGTRHRRRRLGPGDPDRVAADRGVVSAAARPKRQASGHGAELSVPVRRRGRPAVRPRHAGVLVRRMGGTDRCAALAAAHRCAATAGAVSAGAPDRRANLARVVGIVGDLRRECRRDSGAPVSGGLFRA